MGLTSRVSSRTYRESAITMSSCPSNSGIEIKNSGELDKPSRYFVLKRVEFTDNQQKKEVKRFWDYTKSFNSVAICIFNSEMQQLVFVKQFRPALLMELLDRGEHVANYRDAGTSVECCAGLVDKEKPLAQVAAEEVFEETGYKVSAERLELFGKFRRIDSGAHEYVLCGS